MPNIFSGACQQWTTAGREEQQDISQWLGKLYCFGQNYSMFSSPMLVFSHEHVDANMYKFLLRSLPKQYLSNDYSPSMLSSRFQSHCIDYSTICPIFTDSQTLHLMIATKFPLPEDDIHTYCISRVALEILGTVF